MTRRRALVPLTALGLLLIASPASAAGTAPPGGEGKTHVLCIGASERPDSSFDGLCVWVPLPR